MTSLALALDVDDLVEAMRLARLLRPWFGVAKVGLELFSAAGPEAIGALRELGYQVFCDLKLHDIPTTVRARRARPRRARRRPTSHCTPPAARSMLRAGVEGFAAGAARRRAAAAARPGRHHPHQRGRAPAERARRARRRRRRRRGAPASCARPTTCGRRVSWRPACSRVVPGIRPEGAPAHDQAAPVTPRAAIDAGADILVIGRAVTAADDPAAAAAALAASV